MSGINRLIQLATGTIKNISRKYVGLCLFVYLSLWFGPWEWLFFPPLWLCVCVDNITACGACSKTLATTACCLPMNFKSIPIVRERKGRARKSGRPGQCSLRNTITETLTSVHSDGHEITWRQSRMSQWSFVLYCFSLILIYFNVLCRLWSTCLIFSPSYQNHVFLAKNKPPASASAAEIKLWKRWKGSVSSFQFEQNVPSNINEGANAVKVLFTAMVSVIIKI